MSLRDEDNAVIDAARTGAVEKLQQQADPPDHAAATRQAAEAAHRATIETAFAPKRLVKP